MDSQRWERIQKLFHGAADLAAPERGAFLERACAGDLELHREVLALLDEDSSASILDRDMSHIAQALLDGDPGAAKDGLSFRKIGPYRLERLLGEGGMGVVYLAARDDLGSQVAIKLLRDAWMSPARRERFTVEQRTLAQLNHRSIARLYDADTLPDGTPWFAMEYVEGVPLTDYCRAKSSPVEERLRLFRAICEAVDYAHRHAIIHRDLKPSNILVNAEGGARLLDFGIAKQLDPAESSRDQTRTGLRLMTPAYAAPEQIRGEPASIQTDVYSLGVVLYELLAGRARFDPAGRSAGELETMILTREPEKPSAAGKAELGLRRSSWADLDVLCLTAMHKDAGRRYRSVEALIRDLDHYANGEPLEARPDTWRYRAAKFVRRNRRSVIASAAAIALVVGLVIYFTVRLTGARNAALAQAARAQRVQQFTMDLFNGGDKEAGPAEDLRVLELVDRGAAQARSLDREPSVQADLFDTLGGIYQKLGKFDQAETLLSAALAERVSAGRASADVSASQVELGLLRSDQVKLAAAEQLVRDGLKTAQALRPPDNAAVAKALLALGRVLEVRGSYAEAIGVLDQAVKLESSAGPSTPELAATLGELATNHFELGQYDIAKPLYERALAMHRQLLGERHPSVAGDLLALASLQQELGFYTESERLSRQALAIDEPYYGKDHPQTAVSLTELGRALQFEQRYDEAVQVLDRALAIRERVYGKMHPLVADTVNELGSIAYMRDQFDEAEKQFRRMMEIYQAIYHGEAFQFGVAEANLASVYMDRKEYAQAEPLFRDAIRIYNRTQSPTDMNTAIAHAKLGRTLLRAGRYRDAEPESLAAYQILVKQSSPSNSFIRGTSKDLVKIYDALHEPEKAAPFQAAVDRLTQGK